MVKHMQIGEVAERTGLSLRTIRYYEEVGLITPSARSQGGFRLYDDVDLSRLELIMQMKPLGFQLDQMRQLIATLDNTVTGGDSAGVDELRQFSESAEERCVELREKLEVAERFAAMLRRRLGELDGRTSGLRQQ